MQALKGRLQSALKRAGVYHRLKNSHVYDLYWRVADRRLIDARSKEVEFYRSLLTGFRRGDMIFDVGANDGTKADVFLSALSPFLKVDPTD